MRLVFTKEVWTAAIAGRDFPEPDDRRIAGLQRRLDAAGEEFAAIVRDIRDRGEWDAPFVEALCDPPESFSFGGVVAHVLTFSAHRREVIGEVAGGGWLAPSITARVPEAYRSTALPRAEGRCSSARPPSRARTAPDRAGDVAEHGDGA